MSLSICFAIARSLWLMSALFCGLALGDSELQRRLSNRNNNYGNMYQQNGASSYSNYYSVEYYNGSRGFEVCDDSVVEVIELYILCDSPYTFYYGNGANRNSPVCNYGDKISFEVKLRVNDDLREDDSIYMTIAIYDDQENLLVAADPANLCEDYVGADCTSAGYYQFSSRMRLPYPSSDASNVLFLPQMHMAFSTQADAGYNLGAMNIECERWEDAASPSAWLEAEAQRSSWIENFMIEYGLLTLSCSMLVLLVCFVWKQASRQSPACSTTCRKASLLELD